MQLRSALILLVFFALVGACTSEDTAPDGQGPQVGDEVADACGQLQNYFEDLDLGPRPRGDWDRERYIRWSPDGSRILFNGFEYSYGHYWKASDLYSVDSDGARLDRIVDVGDEAPDREWYYWDYANRDPINEDEGTVVYVQQIENAPDRDPVWGDGGMMMYFDVSPDSSRIVYSTCAYTEDPEAELGEPGSYGELVVSDIEHPEDTERTATSRGWAYNYEIVLSDIDGGNVTRLTTNLHPDNFPVWSPDGSKVAFMTQKRDGDHLTIYEVATESFQEHALPSGLSFSSQRMTWSPNGDRIAFVGESLGSTADYPATPSVYVTTFSHFDDSGQVLGFGGPGMPFRIRTTRIWHAASGPAWSPDGQRIAMVVPKPDSGSLYTFAANGSDPMHVTDNLPEPWHPWLGDLEWSPDGSEILLKGFTYRVPLDGSPPIASPLTFIDRDGNSQVETPMDAAWSPDGSTLAVGIDEWHKWHSGGPSISADSSLVFLIDRDNTNIRPLVEVLMQDEEAVQESLPEIALRLAE